MERELAYGVFRRALKAAGEESMRIHDLRHTAASLAVASGATILTVQNMMGHENASTRFKYYAHLFDEHLDDFAERLHERAAAAFWDIPRDSAADNHLRVVQGERRTSP